MVSYIHAPTGTVASARDVADEVVTAARAQGYDIQVCYGFAPFADHSNKRCIDFMIAGEGSEKAGGRTAGHWVAEYVWRNRKRLGLNWQIWDRRIRRYQNTDRPKGAWYGYRGPSPHTDHVHIELDGSPYLPPTDVTPPPVKDKTKTHARIIQINCRLSSVRDDYPWTKRKPSMLKFLKANPASVIGVQECSEDIRIAMVKALGASWKEVHHAKVGLLFDGAKWKLLAKHSFDMDNEAEPDRRLLCVQLQSKRTDATLWFLVSHFGVHFVGAAAERVNQAIELLGHVKDLGILEGVVLADFNDFPIPPKTGVRLTMQGPKGVTLGVFYDLRHCIDVKNGQCDTHHGYKPTDRNGDWTDDILTSENVVVLEGELVLTDPGSDYPNATDHNALTALIEF